MYNRKHSGTVLRTKGWKSPNASGHRPCGDPRGAGAAAVDPTPIMTWVGLRVFMVNEELK